MFNNGNGVPLSMNVAPTGNGNGGNGLWGNDSWIIIILFALIFGWGNGGWGGFGYGGGQSTSVYEGYVLNNDMSMLQRSIADSTNMLERRTDNIVNGLCDGFYTTAQQINGVNTNIMQGNNALATQLADCCCKTQTAIGDVKYAIGSTGADISRGVERGFADTNYNLATQANMLDRTVSDKFCQTNFNAATNTRDIIDSQNAGTRAIIDKLCQMEANAKDEKIAELTAINSDLRLRASQEAQNNYLVDKLGYKMPIPSYQVPNPFCNCQCGQNVYGTTIA